MDLKHTASGPKTSITSPAGFNQSIRFSNYKFHNQLISMRLFYLMFRNQHSSAGLSYKFLLMKAAQPERISRLFVLVVRRCATRDDALSQVPDSMVRIAVARKIEVCIFKLSCEVVLYPGVKSLHHLKRLYSTDPAKRQHP